MGRVSPETAVVGIAAIVTHHKIICGRHDPLAIGFDGAIGFLQIWLVELRAIDKDMAIVNFNSVTRQSDDALDEIGLAFELRSANNYNLLALGITPQRNVPRSEGQAHVVAGAAHDEVIADEQSIFHGFGRNYAGLSDTRINKNEGENNPEPGDGFAFRALTERLL